jgi:beta-N-acetylhexosaminidase
VPGGTVDAPAGCPWRGARLLREDLKFDGVVISDDLANARQVQDVPVRDRAVRFLSAGGDLVITTNPQAADAMYAQVIATATAEGPFALRLRESTQRVLALNASLGLLDCRAFTGVTSASPPHQPAPPPRATAPSGLTRPPD